MKKIATILAVLALCAIAAPAAMEDVKYSLTLTKQQTNSVTYVLRGYVESVYVDVEDNTTNTIVITSDQGTVFSKSGITSDTQFFPRAANQTTGGAAFTYTMTGQLETTTVTSAQSGPIAVAGAVKVSGYQTPGSLTTNAVTVTIIYSK